MNHAGWATTPAAHTTVGHSLPHVRRNHFLRSAMKKRNKTTFKRVHWHPDVIENEHKKPLKPTKQENASALLAPTSQGSSSRVLTTIEKAGTRTGYQAQARPSITGGQSRTPGQSSLPRKPFASPAVSQDVAAWLKATQNLSPTDPNEPDPRSKRSLDAPSMANSGKRRDYVASHSASLAIESRGRPNHGTRRVPPAVPDLPPRLPPHQREGPPPTPRITRLQTPDLPEIGDSGYWACDKIYHRNIGAGKMTEQLNAAKAHIREQQKDKAPRC